MVKYNYMTCQKHQFNQLLNWEIKKVVKLELWNLIKLKAICLQDLLTEKLPFLIYKNKEKRNLQIKLLALIQSQWLEL